MVKRKANLEALRISSMLMIIVLHYLSKGDLLVSGLKGASFVQGLYWVLEAFCAVAVNLYLLLTGYLMVGKEFQWKRVWRLWLQVLFYTIMIPIVLLLLGQIAVVDLNIYRVLPYFLPVTTGHYWFATSYVLLMVCMPFLNYGINQLDKKQFQGLLGFLLLFFSVSKSVLPFDFPMDQSGYGTEWMVCVYLVGAYVYKYGIPFYTTWVKSAICYVLGCSFIVLWFGLGSAMEGVQELFYGWRVDAYHNNHVFNLVAALSLFHTFLMITIPEGFIERIIVKIAPHVFAVYLIHEHFELRYNWIEWLGVMEHESTGGQLLNLFMCVVIIFVVGVSVDMVRSKLFSLVEKRV